MRIFALPKDRLTEEWPEIRFALSRGFPVSGLSLSVTTRGGALPESRLPRAIIVRPFRAFSLRLRRQLTMGKSGSRTGYAKHYLRNLSLFAVLLLAFAGCSTTHHVAGAKDDSETVMVTYRVQSGKETEFEALLADAWKVYRAEGLVYSEPHLIVRDADGEGKTRYVEIFTWGKSPDHPPASVQGFWQQEQALCESRDGHRGIEGGEVNLVTAK
jgi:hypothetical protein